MAALLVAGCGTRAESPADSAQAGGDGPVYGDTLVHSPIGDISGLIPSLTADAASHEVGNRIYDALIRTIAS